MSSDSDFLISESDESFGFSPIKTLSTTKKTTTKKTTSSTNSGRATKRQKTSPVSARTTASASVDYSSDESEVSLLDSPAPLSAKDKEALQKRYKKVSQLEHILLRPDTYVGSIEARTETLWVYDDGIGMTEREITYVPGLYKIFDEILVNAADHKQVCDAMTQIKVVIDTDENTISVWNNGEGIPVSIHPTEKMYVPEMIFGHLLTSSNYDDSEDKVTGGRNGYGAKLANIFSTKFVVETLDTNQHKKYTQVFLDNMSRKENPVIKRSTAKTAYTKITFTPDLKKFGMEDTGLDTDIVALMRKRVYDVAGCNPTVGVWLNGTKIKINTFQHYVNLYVDSLARGDSATAATTGAVAAPVDRQRKVVYQRISDRWDVAVFLTDGAFQQVSFVNSINTSRGGSHVDYLTNQITRKLRALASKKRGAKKNIQGHHLKQQMFIFIRSLIVNPAFDSQTKETLTIKSSKFGSRPQVDDKFINGLVRAGILDQAGQFASFKAQLRLGKSGGTKKRRLTGIAKLDDANKAGTRDSQDCTLILTEGDSAKTLAVSGLSVVGRDYYGVFPLRGKLLNVRDAPTKQVLENSEINHIKQILGLKHNVDYSQPDKRKQLRYGHLMIMTDQDHDGSHIKGLLINFVHKYWPKLLTVPGFMLEFVTPIVKARKGKTTLSFYTVPEYMQWKDENNNGRGWFIKYYKGLGTSSAVEAREYFSDLERNRIRFVVAQKEKPKTLAERKAAKKKKTAADLEDIDFESKSDFELIEMAFSKSEAGSRKLWLKNVAEGTFLDQNVDEISYKDFINKELVLFSLADCRRSIPHLMDGLKPGQRKVLYSAFTRNLRKEIKVAQLAGYVSEKSAYHHGEVSLQGTIINMAQNFVGSNNINLLFPEGMFGSRIQGGKDAASARYINTRLSVLARAIFPEQDDLLLTYLEDDGMPIEPETYYPIIPMVLVNGAEGIGTGYSTSIPNYSPHDIVDNLLALIDDKPLRPMVPWYRHFEGEILAHPAKPGQFLCRGRFERSGSTLRVYELPIRYWTQNFKEHLEKFLVATNNDETARRGSTRPVPANLVTDYREYSTDFDIFFEIEFASVQKLEELSDDDILKLFKLQTKINTSNMNLFVAKEIENDQGPEESTVPDRFENPEEIIKYFYKHRLEMYRSRKTFQVAQLREQASRLSEQARFIELIVADKLVIKNRSRQQIIAELNKHSFKEFHSSLSKKKIIKEGGFKRTIEQEATTNADPTIDPAAVVTATTTTASTSTSTSSSAASSSSSSSSSSSKAGSGFDYLLKMNLWALSKEKIALLKKKVAETQQELEALLLRSEKDIWKEELNTFIHLYETEGIKEDELAKLAVSSHAAAGGGKKRGKKRGRGKKKVVNSAPVRPEFKTSFRAEYKLAEYGSHGVVMPKRLKKESKSSLLKKTTTTIKKETKKPVAKKSTIKKPAANATKVLMKAAAKQKQAALLDSDDDSFIDEKSPVKKAPAKKAPAKKQTILSDEDFSDELSDDDFSVDITPPPRQRRTSSRRAATRAKAKSYAAMMISDDSDDDAFLPTDDSDDDFQL